MREMPASVVSELIERCFKIDRLLIEAMRDPVIPLAPYAQMAEAQIIAAGLRAQIQHFAIRPIAIAPIDLEDAL